MGLIEKLQEIKDLVDNLPSGGGTGEDIDYTDVNGQYRCYGLSNPNLIKFLCDNMHNSGTVDYNQCFNLCSIDVSDYFIPNLKHHTDIKPSTSRVYPFGNEYDFYNFKYTFYGYEYNGTLKLNVDNYPIYGESCFAAGQYSIKKLETETGEIWIGNGNSTFSNCYLLEEIPLIKLDNCVLISALFNNCRKLKIIRFKGRLGHTSKNSNLSFAATNVSLSFSSVFNGCSLLENVMGLDVTNVPKTITTTNMFKGCTSLTQLDFSGSEDFMINIDITETALNREELLNMLNTIPVSSGTPTITIGTDKMTLLTEEDIALFAEKNITLA